MVDKALFIDSGAAKDSMRQLEIIANNLANVGTTGFRADHEVFKAINANKQDKQTRVYAMIDKSYSDFNPGPVIATGRDLDVAISGPGFIAVQNKNGDQAYTRAGDLQIKNGFLATRTGELVLGTSGMISIPDQAQRIVIGPDGNVSVKLADQQDLISINYIRLTNPPTDKLYKAEDGMFYLPNGETVRADATVRLTPASLEGSNVNPVEALTSLIELSRRFEFHANLMKNFEDNASKANQLLNLPR